jgi:two-component system, chemotaxis family, chemotaxis protein CheY
MGGFRMVKVLVVDDSLFMRTSISGILNRNGYSVIGIADDGDAAIDAYKKLKPDLVTMDITMVNVDGISAIKEIIKLDSEANIIVCSAMSNENVICEAIRAGAKEYILKPFDEHQVLNSVKRLFPTHIKS